MGVRCVGLELIAAIAARFCPVEKTLHYGCEDLFDKRGHNDCDRTDRGTLAISAAGQRHGGQSSNVVRRVGLSITMEPSEFSIRVSSPGPGLAQLVIAAKILRADSTCEPAHLLNERSRGYANRHAQISELVSML